jgi:hypothetical protein
VHSLRQAVFEGFEATAVMTPEEILNFERLELQIRKTVDSNKALFLHQMQRLQGDHRSSIISSADHIVRAFKKSEVNPSEIILFIESLVRVNVWCAQELIAKDTLIEILEGRLQK